MRKLLFLYTFIAFQAASFAQERTHLPYSVFGIGEINSKGFARNMAMGKSGIALSSGLYLNNLNPASLHSLDSVSFFFDFGLKGDFVKYRDAYNTQYGNDVNMRNIALGFRINSNWSASIGISPYSTVGYKIITEKNLEGTNENFPVELAGNGGLNQLYWDNSYLLFNRLSLGVNFTYLFGNIETTESVSYPKFTYDIIYKQNSYLKKVYADFGAQYFFPVGKNIQVTLGGVFGNSHKLNFKHSITISQSDGSVTADEITERGTFNFPLYAGGGIALLFKNNLTFTADYVYHDWAGTNSDNIDFKYVNTNTIRAGIEFRPGHFNQIGYFGTIAYRAGFYHEDSYIEVNKVSAADKGFTLGLGLPFLQNKTSINIAYNVGVNGTLKNELIKENYHSFMVSLTLHDWWFIKRKYD